MKQFKQLALNVIDIEQQAIEEIKQYINDDFELACQLMFDCKGQSYCYWHGEVWSYWWKNSSDVS